MPSVRYHIDQTLRLIGSNDDNKFTEIIMFNNIMIGYDTEADVAKITKNTRFKEKDFHGIDMCITYSTMDLHDKAKDEYENVPELDRLPDKRSSVERRIGKLLLANCEKPEGTFNP